MRQINAFDHVVAAWLGVALLLMSSLVFAQTDRLERIEWKKAPIRLELVVGQEQRIEFPAAVKVGVPASVQTLVRAQSINGTVYLLAHAPFGSNRLMVRELDSGRIYLFDVTATEEGGASPPIQIYVTGDTDPGRDTVGIDADRSPPDYIQLTRFAARQLYAPSRLVKDRPGFVRVPVKRDAVDLYRGGTIEATPLVAWRAGGLYVTAVKLTNRTDQPRILDPRNLRGAWLTATFQHHRLLPMGDEADTTAVYLISARSFEVSLPHGYRDL
jgi:integrating conjugative element protein (TIGR03749 family)